ncbi:MAG: RDD family protein [Methylococcaceae bacterium]
MSLKAKELLKPGHNIKTTPGFFRRLAAQIYDFILLIALLFIATALLLPFTSGEAVIPQQTLIYRIYLTVISFFFYGWFWTHGGQTLGLRAWKIKVLTLDQKPIGWTQALLRFATAIVSWVFCGLGFLWMLIDRNKRSWHDYLSKTAVFFDSPATDQD